MAVIGRRKHFIPMINTIARKAGVDPVLLTAIVAVESDFDPWAVRFEKDYAYSTIPNKFAENNRISLVTEITCQKMSWGLCQIMGGTLRFLGFGGPLAQMVDPGLNLQYACKYILKLGNQYPHYTDMISAYNAGSLRKEDGEYVNAEYVKKVLAEMDREKI